jgi:hypothetical protein
VLCLQGTSFAFFSLDSADLFPPTIAYVLPFHRHKQSPCLPTQGGWLP